MKQENITSTATHYLALGALALTLASAPARADWVTVRADGSTQTTRNAPNRDGDRDDSYDGPGRLKQSPKRDNLSIYNPPPVDNRMRVGSPNNSFEPGRTRIDSTYSYVPGYVPAGLRHSSICVSADGDLSALEHDDYRARPGLQCADWPCSCDAELGEIRVITRNRISLRCPRARRFTARKLIRIIRLTVIVRLRPMAIRPIRITVIRRMAIRIMVIPTAIARRRMAA